MAIIASASGPAPPSPSPVSPSPVSPSSAAPGNAGHLKLAPLADLIAVRVAAGGATRAELVRDLRPITHPDLAPALWRARADAAVAELIALGLVVEVRTRLKATELGLGHAAAALGVEPDGLSTWADVRGAALVARALGLPAGDRGVIKALANPDSLRILIVQCAFGLGEAKAQGEAGQRIMSLSKLRAALAVRALERAFGNQIKSGLGSGSGLGPKPSRLLAAQLSKTPRDYGSDGRLIAALAAEHVGAANAETETLKIALLKRAFKERCEAQTTPKPVAAKTHTASPAPVPPKAVANDRGVAGQRPLPSARPDLPGFIKAVQAAANLRAEGWPGNRKAFISHVWQEIKAAHPAWALSEIEFKGMLAEAHRLGGLILANADLKDKKHIQEFENSAIQYKNTVWHFVRVEEP